MIRREYLTLCVAIGATGLGGCLGSDGGGGSNNSGVDPSELTVEVDFQVNGSNLVVSHNSGDPIPAGETVYVTIGGDVQNEIQLADDVHAGGDIIRVEGADNNFQGKKTVALYINSGGESFELQTGEVTFSSPPTVAFDVGYDEDSQTVFVTHNGGDSVDRENLIITGDVDDAPMAVPGDGSMSAGSDFEIEGLQSGDEIQIVWESDDGEQSSVLATYEVP